MEIAVWIFGTLAVISLFLSHQMRGRGGILAFKLSADVFWGVHYFCLGAFAGMIPNAVGILRETVFINRHRSRVLASRLWPALFVLINATLGALKFSALYDLLPLCASAAVTVSLWIENPRLTKYISLPVSSAFLLYDLFVHSYLGVFNEALAILSILIFFAKEIFLNKLIIVRKKNTKIRMGVNPTENFISFVFYHTLRFFSSVLNPLRPLCLERTN